MLDLKGKSSAADHPLGEGQRIIVGLDVGTTKVCAIVGQLNSDNKIEVLGIGKVESSGVKRGRISNVTATTEAIKQAVERASDLATVDIEDVIVGIAGSHIKMRIQNQNRVRPDNLKVIKEAELLEMENEIRHAKTRAGEQIIHVLPQEYVIDGEVHNSALGMIGHSLGCKYLVIYGSELEVANKCISESGVVAEGFVIEPLASAQAVLSKEEMQEGVAMVDMGGGTTDVVIFKNNKVRYTEMIPLGGDNITSDIREVLNIPRSHAEKLKLKFGSAIALEDQRNVLINIPGIHGREPREVIRFELNSIIQARVEEIFELVAQSIAKSGCGDQLPCGLVLTGGCAQLQKMIAVSDIKTGLHTRIGLPNFHLADVNKRINNPSLSTGIGLVIYGLGNSVSNQTDTLSSKSKTKKGLFGLIKDLWSADKDIERSVKFG